WTTITERAVIIRHELHKQPELAWQEQKTAQLIRMRLSELGIPFRSCAQTGTVAQIKGGSSRATIALRADMDGLPIHEISGVPWQSRVEGTMHACGHVGHTA